MAATWKTSTSTTAVKCRRECVQGIDGRVDQTETYDGKLEDLQALGKAVGQAFAALDGSTVTIQRCRYVTAARGPVAQLILECSNRFSGSGSGADTVYEREFQRVDKDIRYHPMFLSGGTYALTDQNRIDVEKALRTQSATDIAALGTNPKKLFDKLQRGQTAYPVFVPVARQTRPGLHSQNTGPCGGIANPPVQCAAPTQNARGDALTYVKMADRAVHQGGQWSHVEEWTGVEKIDTDIFT